MQMLDGRPIKWRQGANKIIDAEAEATKQTNKTSKVIGPIFVTLLVLL